MQAVQSIGAIGAESLWHPVTQHTDLNEKPMVPIVSGEGPYITDENDKRYMEEAISGIWCVNVGYGREEMAIVAYQQMEKIAYASVAMTTEPSALIAQKLLQH